MRDSMEVIMHASIIDASECEIHKLALKALDVATKSGSVNVCFDDTSKVSQRRFAKHVRKVARDYKCDYKYQVGQPHNDTVYIQLYHVPTIDLSYVIENLERYGNSVINGGTVRVLGLDAISKHIKDSCGKKVTYQQSSNPELDYVVVKVKEG